LLTSNNEAATPRTASKTAPGFGLGSCPQDLAPIRWGSPALTSNNEAATPGTASKTAPGFGLGSCPQISAPIRWGSLSSPPTYESLVLSLGCRLVVSAANPNGFTA
jgi:hypothetical protein